MSLLPPVCRHYFLDPLCFHFCLVVVRVFHGILYFQNEKAAPASSPSFKQPLPPVSSERFPNLMLPRSYSALSASDGPTATVTSGALQADVNNVNNNVNNGDVGTDRSLGEVLEKLASLERKHRIMLTDYNVLKADVNAIKAEIKTTNLHLTKIEKLLRGLYSAKAMPKV